MKSILDPTFKYVPSTKTNVAKTFDRIRKEMREKEKSLQTVQDVRQLNIVQHQKFYKG